MTPQAALDAQIEKYRAMTGEERLQLAFDLHELVRNRARRHPPPTSRSERGGSGAALAKAHRAGPQLVTEQELAIDAVRRLNRAGVAYLLTGSMASNYWGVPRTTHDLDFVVQLPVESIPHLLREFRDDFHLDELAVRAAFAPPYQFNAIDRRSALKIDFWMLRSDPFAMSMFQRRLRINFLGELAWLATAEDVILHKLYWDSLTPPSARSATPPAWLRFSPTRSITLTCNNALLNLASAKN